MKRITSTRGIAACVAGATIGAFALLAGSAQASFQQTSCASTGLVVPILGTPSCTTPPIDANLDSDVGHSFIYTAQSKAQSLFLPAGTKIELIINGFNIGQIASCQTTASTCTATRSNTGAVIPLGWHDLRIRCTWNSGLAIIALKDCKQTLITAAPTTEPGV